MQGAAVTPTITDPVAAGATGIFDRIFVPVDLTIASHYAMGVALALKRTFGSEVCVFELAEQTGGDEFLAGLGNPLTPAELARGTEERLRRFIENIAPGFGEAVHVRARLAIKPVREIRYEAHEWEATLLVVATKFEGLLRSPAERLIHGFDIPVLLIPAVDADRPVAKEPH